MQTVRALERALVIVGEGGSVVGVRAIGDDEFGALFRRKAPEIREPLLRHERLHILADMIDMTA